MWYAGGKKAKIEEEEVETSGNLEEENVDGLTEEEAPDDADGPALPLGLTGRFSQCCFSDNEILYVDISSLNPKMRLISLIKLNGI